MVSIPTRKSAVLELLLTDLHTQYHPPTTLPPLQVDDDKSGKDSDHDVVLFAPLTNQKYKIQRIKKTVKIRPIVDSQIPKFVKALASYPWQEKMSNLSPDEQADTFHTFQRQILDTHFPEKTVKISSLDKKWFSPKLKQLHRKMQRAFHKDRKSQNYKSLKRKFKQMKRNAIKRFYEDFVTDLKSTNPAKWYSMAKQIGAVDQLSLSQKEVKVAALAGLSNGQAAQKIAAHFAAISNEYSCIDNTQLPCYLPAPPPPQVEEHEVYARLNRLKKTRSTLPIDIPEKLRQECALFLAEPVSLIINNSLVQSQYPAAWKQEWVTPVPKISHPEVISDLRKISGTSDYSKVFEAFLKDWIMEDISNNIDIGEFGGQAGIGTEHLIVSLLDRVLKLLDKQSDRSAVLMTCIDWSAAFDRQDPTLAIKRFLELGVRPSLIPLLSNYLTDRKMQVKFNGELSEFFKLVGGGPQGTLLGQIEYLVQSNNNANTVPPDACLSILMIFQ